MQGNMVGEMKLMIAEEQKFQGKALSLSHTKTAITTIKEKFTEQQLQMFEQSYFCKNPKQNIKTKENI